ncbi:MAG: Threonylcarbamoyl-AMP synthase [Thermocaproicibacter melissae]|jgi:L-threonylcarbamoyladenylate synthase|uniref:L-threonylcarbamoyladenylate synthase n=1 Tax=Thermocaproicibacter melissae TaxID=2966552 RepID=UPI0024B16A73|nr:L-threonylcarbamoyladenylate synthase [Thermocaproicibacter melissae]WBY63486.1 L-threonylcarbamoyladenylate synthase [Thermocaproicibacter melissae]
MHTLLLNAAEPGAIEEAARIIRNGGLVGMPTETVYGLAANALDAKAVAKIFEAKGRPQDNPLIVHISAFEQIRRLVKSVPESAEKLAKAYWPGPMTMVLEKSDLIPDIVSAGLPTVGIRFPSHPVAQALITAAGVPIAAPSANRSGLPSTTTAEHVMRDMDGRIDAVLDGGTCGVGVESTIVTLASDPPRLLRPGGITLEQLQAVLGRVDVDKAVLNPLPKDAKPLSPGMKYKHYSPKANIIIIQSDEKTFADFVNSHKAPGVAVLCYTGEEKLVDVPAVCYGGETDYEAQARDLFEALRHLDDIGAKTVYARCPEPKGVGLAVYNRLMRAAGFEVLKLA